MTLQLIVALVFLLLIWCFFPRTTTGILLMFHGIFSEKTISEHTGFIVTVFFVILFLDIINFGALISSIRDFMEKHRIYKHS